MHKVCVTKCENYEYQRVEDAIFHCLERIPELKQKIKQEMKVVVKANLVSNQTPEKAITTHPNVVKAIVRYFQSFHCAVTIADSPGAPHGFTKQILKTVYDETGMSKVADETGCNLNFDTSIIDVESVESVCLKKMTLARYAYDADLIVSAAKLKTHAMMMYTGAVKNLFGTIPGIIKMKYHYKLKDARTFGEHLVDICEYVKPTLSIIDAIDCMEGNGPSAGIVRHMGLVMASENPYIVDLAATTIVGFDPFEVPTISSSIKRGLITGSIKDIDMMDLTFEDLEIKPFILPDTINKTDTVPVINYSLCIGCGICSKVCPAQIIKMINKKPSIQLESCIKCYCCHELCPEKAVKIEKFHYWDLSSNHKINV
ncbi:iron-sulfur protein [Anaerocolumna cellulosilytica]|uniref:Iron-sulfur protein n=1 Tax=Anaerocolumna cellulosilytica TaxID=433286 RepID=A0A6S6QYK2_9FIRM|nr:DUF362 domain-containing protein [Anaerocolumna cellulosilytica]MBB5193950.1 uncharacterized protein (DUF362 family) [Anaerocolumna cellulosilytica]BCJ94836.1 iron-sulfur protein [Anaerocolumna cellulosilytica]